MSKTRKQRKQNKDQKHAGKAMIGPAPFLQKKSITFEDIVAVSGDAINGDNVSIMNGNGFTNVTNTIEKRVP